MLGRGAQAFVPGEFHRHSLFSADTQALPAGTRNGQRAISHPVVVRVVFMHGVCSPTHMMYIRGPHEC